METNQSNNRPISPGLQNIYSDAVEVATLKQQGTLRGLDTTIQGRISYIRDTVAVAIPLLVGAITLLSISPNLVKTKWLFYIGSGLLVVSILLGTIGRGKLIIILENSAIALQTWVTEIAEASRFAKYNPEDQVKAHRLVTAEQAGVSIPNISWFAENVHRIVAFFLLTGFLALGLALLFKIST